MSWTLVEIQVFLERWGELPQTCLCASARCEEKSGMLLFAMKFVPTPSPSLVQNGKKKSFFADPPARVAFSG